jgi:hypothetical protein
VRRGQGGERGRREGKANQRTAAEKGVGFSQMRVCITSLRGVGFENRMSLLGGVHKSRGPLSVGRADAERWRRDREEGGGWKLGGPAGEEGICVFVGLN